MLFKLKKQKEIMLQAHPSKIWGNNQFSKMEMTGQSSNFQDVEHDKNRKTSSKAM